MNVGAWTLEWSDESDGPRERLSGLVQSCAICDYEIISPPDSARESALFHRIERAGLAQALIDSRTGRSVSYDHDLLSMVASGQEARDELVTAMMPLVSSYVLDYSGLGVDAEDLTHEGYSGLISAVSEFDYTTGRRFRGFAQTAARHNIQKVIIGQRFLINLNAELFRNREAALHMENVLSYEGEYEVTNREIAEELGLPAAVVALLLSDAPAIFSLESRGGNAWVEVVYGEKAVFENDGNLCLLDGEAVAFAAVWRSTIRRSFQQLLAACLGDQERDIVNRRLGSALSPVALEEIGQHLGITGELVRQIEYRAIAKLRRKADPRKFDIHRPVPAEPEHTVRHPLAAAASVPESTDPQPAPSTEPLPEVAPTPPSPSSYTQVTAALGHVPGTRSWVTNSDAESASRTSYRLLDEKTIPTELLDSLRDLARIRMRERARMMHDRLT